MPRSARVPRLAHLGPPSCARVQPATAATTWAGFCHPRGGEPWLAWNVTHDERYSVASLTQVHNEIVAASSAPCAATLLFAVSDRLKHLAPIAATDFHHLPGVWVTHQPAKAAGKFTRIPARPWDSGDLDSETASALLPGETIHVKARHPGRDMWWTFNHARALPGDPDTTTRLLGLTHDPKRGPLIRIEMNRPASPGVGGPFIPTLFDALPSVGPSWPDWRARPLAGVSQPFPWGYARDMETDGPGLPEILFAPDASVRMVAQSLGPVTRDWSQRPYLSRGGPR